MVLEVTVTCPGEHRMTLERVGATGGSWVCYLIKKKGGNGIFQGSPERKRQRNQRVSSAFQEHRVRIHRSGLQDPTPTADPGPCTISFKKQGFAAWCNP